MAGNTEQSKFINLADISFKWKYPATGAKNSNHPFSKMNLEAAGLIMRLEVIMEIHLKVGL